MIHPNYRPHDFLPQHDCRAVANAFLQHYAKHDPGALTPVRLEKLVYLADIFHWFAFDTWLCRQRAVNGIPFPYYHELRHALRFVGNNNTPALITRPEKALAGFTTREIPFTSEFAAVQRKLLENLNGIVREANLTESQLTALITGENSDTPLDQPANTKIPASQTAVHAQQQRAGQFLERDLVRNRAVK